MPLFRVLSTAVVCQALGSLTNFLLNFYLLHSMAPTEFGVFGIGFAAMIVLNGFWQGFFITQYIVLTPGEDRTRFPSQVYTAMVLVSACVAVIVAVISAALLLYSNMAFFVLGVGLSAIAFSFKEFHIRHAISKGTGKQAVLVNAIMGAALSIFLWVTSLFDLELKAELAFTIYAIALTISAIAGHIFSSLKISDHSRSNVFETMRRLAIGGKWAIGTNVIFSLRNNAHVIVLAGILGPAAVATVNAARLFLSPPILLLPALTNVTLPHFSHALHKGGRTALRRSQTRIISGLLVVVAGYSAILMLIWPFLEIVLVGDQYQGLFPIVVAWCAFTTILMLRSVIDWGGQAERRFAIITKVSVGVALIALAAAWILTIAAGPLGAVLALVFAELAMIWGLWVALNRPDQRIKVK